MAFPISPPAPNKVRSLSVGSLYSITEGSEPISENEEIQSVIEFRNQGDRAFGDKDYVEAIKCYSEALEIDGSNTDILSARAAVYMETKQYEMAQKDAEILVKVDPLIPQGHYLLAVSLDNQNKYDKAITSFLHALDHDTQHEDQLVDNIAVVASNLCNFSDSVLKDFEEMVPVQKLSEVGIQLYKENYHDACIEVLTRVLKMEPQQKQCTMMSLLTLGSAHLSLKEITVSKNTFQECLKTAMTEKDPEIESKCYVNLANIYLLENNTQQAIVYFEKLFSIGRDLKKNHEDGSFPEYWSLALQCGIHENLSIAYREIHNFPQALHHSMIYLKLVQNNKEAESALPMAHYNLATYYDMVKDYTAALSNYKTYLDLCKTQGDKIGMAKAYASLGNVYKIVCNFKLSESYLEQYLHMSQKTKDYDGQAKALCFLGELFQAKEDYDKALSFFEQYLRMSRRLEEFVTECRAFLKVADIFKCQGRYQHAQYYYEMALTLANKLENNEELVNQCRCEVAFAFTMSILKDDMEKSKSMFMDLIPVYSKQIQLYEDENIECPNELTTRLQMCYDGMQIALCKLDQPDAALEYAESFRKRRLQQILKHKLNTANVEDSEKQRETISLPSRDELCKIVNKQKCTVLYYSITDPCLLIWVLKPGEGVVRAQVEKSIGSDSFRHKVRKALELLQKLDNSKADLDCEKRALPSKNRKVTHLQKKNLAKSTEWKTRENREEVKRQDTGGRPQKILYDLLVAPIEKMLIDVKDLLIIADKEICQVPMDALQDDNDTHMSEKFNIISVPSLSVQTLIANKTDSTKPDKSNFEYTDFFPVYLDDHLRVVVPPDECPFSPLRTTQRSAPLMAREKSSTPSFIAFGKNYHDCVPTPEDKKDREKLIVAQNKSKLGTLITSASTGIEVVRGEGTAIEYKQDSHQHRSLVIGNPSLPNKLKLHEQVWHPAGELIVSQCEAYNVAEYLETEAIVGSAANKGHILNELTQATLVHIATYGSWEDNVLVFSPNPTSEPTEDGSYNEDQYQIGVKDIMSIKLKADLVVLSCCYGDVHRDVDFTLPTALLLADGNRVSNALSKAKQSLAKDERFNDAMFWAPFLLVGQDIFISIRQIKHAMLDQLVDILEKDTLDVSPVDHLNLTQQPVDISSKDVTLPKLRQHLSQLLIYKQPQVMSVLLQLVSESMVLHTNPQMDLLTKKLPEVVMMAPGSIPLLNLLGFHFQAKGANNTEPYVVYPHWDHDGLLQPAHQALMAVTDVLDNSQCCHALSQLLLQTEDILSGLLDIVSVTKHSCAIQLKISDIGVQALWGYHMSRDFLLSIGFQQVGLLLLFRNTLANRKLLNASLFLLAAVLGEKGQAMLNKIDVNYLGMTKQRQERDVTTTQLKLPSLNPVMVSRNMIHMSTPWLTVRSDTEENQRKMKMAKNLSDVHSEYRYHMMKAHDWHDYTLKPQAGEAIDIIGKSKHKPSVIKVHPNKGTSCTRVPVYEDPTLNINGTEQRRDYSHFLLHTRSDSVLQRHKEACKKIFLPYVKKLTPAD
uniref:Tetratricopeptide repeat protein 28-like n=1 Tax=Saccoglossus kowalevskii TaxID=10224 RepID=A0ABM0GM20_SACKO|nr:PREDICTED: tetratricopeptide repeat protein 28-like [Saccoglossus kowalevskii]